VDRVTVEDLNRVGPAHLTRLFDPEQSRTSLVCSPAKVEEIKKGFEDMGVKLTALESVDELSS
jgi:hypothetical protein